MTIAQALKFGIKELPGISDAPDLDAPCLLLYILHRTEVSWLWAHGEETVSDTQRQHYQQLLAERKTGRPLAYILGSWEFYGREFIVTPDVLIPRPSTEELIDQALEFINKEYTRLGRPLTIADIGTGSGCIAVTLALEMPKMIKKVYATDVSTAALIIARQNAERHGVAAKIEFVTGDMLEPLIDKKIDLIVSNPPYVPSGELESPSSVETQGLKFEPVIALDGGPDGQKYLRQLQTSLFPKIVESMHGKISST